MNSLATLVALCSWVGLVAHHVDPGVPFPLAESWALAGAIAATTLIFPVPVAVRTPLALVTAGLLLRAGLPAAHSATFPWIELGRARTPPWEELAVFGLCAGAAAGAARGGSRWVYAALSVLALGVTLLLPIKASFQKLTPATSGVTSPVLAWSEPGEVIWTRVNTEGLGILYLPAFIRDEWALMGIAGGIHQDAARRAAAKGEGSALDAPRQALRYALWRSLAGVAALAWVLRVAVPFTVVFPLFFSRLAPLRRVATFALFLVPIANLVALVVGVFLPDDGWLRLAALASSVWTLALFRLVSREG